MMEEKNTILICDDDPSFVDVLRMFLEAKGFGIFVAYEGIRAIEVANKERPDLILLDWKMPAGAGGNVLQALRTHRETTDIPVIILTGFHDFEMNRIAGKWRIPIIRKPYDSEDLLQKIETSLHIPLK